MKRITAIAIFMAALGLGARNVSAQVDPSSLPPEAPRIDGDPSPVAIYGLMALFTALVLAGTFTNANRNNMTEVR
jgi:hypothetical protein